MSAFIDLTEAAEMTRNFRGLKETILGTIYQNLQILPVCETFDAAQVQDMLSNSGCAGLRVYYGMDDTKKIHAILVGVDDQGKDILPEDDNAGNYILERGIRTPPAPLPTSLMNS